MDLKITIDAELRKTFPDIRLGCLTYQANVQKTNPQVWSYMESEVIPNTLRLIDEKTLVEIEGIHCSREAYKAFG